MQNCERSRWRDAEHYAATKILANTGCRDESASLGRPIQVAVARGRKVVRERAVGASSAEDLQNLEAGARLADLEKRSRAGWVRSTLIVKAVQESVAPFYQGDRALALVVQAGFPVLLKCVEHRHLTRSRDFVNSSGASCHSIKIGIRSLDQNRGLQPVGADAVRTWKPKQLGYR